MHAPGTFAHGPYSGLISSFTAAENSRIISASVLTLETKTLAGGEPILLCFIGVINIPLKYSPPTDGGEQFRNCVLASTRFTTQYVRFDPPCLFRCLNTRLFLLITEPQAARPVYYRFPKVALQYQPVNLSSHSSCKGSTLAQEHAKTHSLCSRGPSHMYPSVDT